MTILVSELKMQRSISVSDAGSNGGIMGPTEEVSGSPSSLFPNAGASDRAAGAVQYRKLFFKVANIDDLPLLNARIWQDTNTVGDDRMTFFAGTQRDTQSSITGSENKYGMGLSAAGILANSSTIGVNVEDGATVIFRNGGLIRISNRPDPFSSGDEHWARIDQAPTVSGNLVTLHFTPAVPVPFLSNSKVSSVLEAGTVQSSVSDITLTSSLGSLAGTPLNFLKGSGIGSIEQNWTLTFTSGTAFTIAGDTVGSVGSGNISSGATPNNPAVNKPYFTLLSGLLVGTFANGETLTFSTHPAAAPTWLRRVIPAGAGVAGPNTASIYIDGEAA